MSTFSDFSLYWILTLFKLVILYIEMECLVKFLDDEVIDFASRWFPDGTKGHTQK
jgi:hypothetical protein